MRILPYPVSPVQSDAPDDPRDRFGSDAPIITKRDVETVITDMESVTEILAFDQLYQLVGRYGFRIIQAWAQRASDMQQRASVR